LSGCVGAAVVGFGVCVAAVGEMAVGVGKAETLDSLHAAAPIMRRDSARAGVRRVMG
jgi:hypothetical protein